MNPDSHPQNSASTAEIDRLAIRSRPQGSPLMFQRWENLLFLHWPVSAELIRPLIPERFTIDSFEGQAWVSITPFTLSGLRPILIPPIPGFSSFHELNVRTYVHADGVPGLWFFSLYASKILPVVGARLVFSLPYRQASIEVGQDGAGTHFYLRRRNSPSAEFEATWEPGPSILSPAVDSLEFFLIERYCLYASGRGKHYRCRVYHVPWDVRAARLKFYKSNLFAAEGLLEPAGSPLVHYGGDQEVQVWPVHEI